MHTPSFFTSLLQSSLGFSLIAVFLFLLLRSPLSKRLTSNSKLLLWILVFLPLLISSKFTITYSSQSSNQPTFQFFQAINKIDPSQYIDWGILEPDASLEENQIEGLFSSITASTQKYSIFLFVWISGALLVATFYCFQMLSLRALLSGSKKVNQTETVALHQQLLSELKIKRCIPLYQTTGIGTAAIVGVFRPAILLSPEILKCSREQQHSVLLHELSHYRNAHMWINSFALLCTTLHWFNPFVWLAYRELRRSIELACDEAAIRSQKEPLTPESYAHHLIDLMSQFSSMPNYRLSFLGLFNNIETRFIKQRIVMIKNTSTPKLPTTLVLLFGLSCSALAFADLTPGEDAPPPPPLQAPPPPPPANDQNPPPPPPPEEQSQLPVAHIDEIDLNFDTFAEEPKFSEGAKNLIKSEILGLLQSDDPMQAYEPLKNSKFAGEAQIEFLLGNICLQNGKLAMAERHYIEALKSHPGYQRALKNLILIYATSDYQAEAYPLIKKYIELAPEKDAQMFLMAGVSAMQLEKYVEAVEYLLKTHQLDPDDKNATLNLFHCYSELGQWENAEAILQKAISVTEDPIQLSNLHRHYANVAMALGNPTLAAEQIELSLKLNPNGPEPAQATQMLKEIYLNNPDLRK